MKSWDELSMAEKADVMKIAIEGGVYDLGSIREGYNEYAKGGKIHIDPSKKGTFTAAASRHGKSVQAFASQVLAHPENYSPAMRKKANFARNAAKWKHGDGGNLYAPGGEITYGRPYYSYDENGKKVDDTLNYNATLPEIIITPDSKKSPAERAVLERERRRNNDAYYGRGTYNAKLDREQTELEKIASQKAWENSIEKQALDYAQAATTGIGIGADIVSGLPIYSSLKGARVLSEAETPMDYAEGALWLTPIAGVAGREAMNAGKQVVGKVAEAARPIIENEGVAITNPFTGDINWIGKGLGSYIEVSPTSDGWLGVDYINSTRSGTGRKLYDAAIEEAHKRGLKGVKSGESLHSAPKTYNIWEHYPDKVHLGDYGSHGNSSMIDAAMTTKVNSPEELIEATKHGINAAVMKKAPVYGLTNPSGDVPLLSLSKGSFPNITAEQENLIKDVLSKFTSNGETTGVKAMSISDREAGYNRMKEFINSPEYKERLKAAGMEDYGDYMVGLIEKRLNGKNFFPAWRADSILGKNYRGLSEVDPTDIDYGVTVRSDLQGNDFLQTFDHELAHWSTENTSPSFWKDLKESILHNKTPNLKLQKLMRYNDKIAPTKTMEEYLNTQNPNMSKKELAEAKRKFRYVSSGQERRARAYSMIQEAKRRGISTDELVDMYTIEGELLGEAPKQLLELNMVYTPENLKKYLKGFLSITTPTTLGINIAANE